jgi:hypothetical protein
MNLIVNPLAAIEVAESDKLLTGGPVPGRGMKTLEISAVESPRIYELFRELSVVGLSQLDIQADLGEEDVRLLSDHGVLVEAGNVAERPLFSCMLDDVDASPLPNSTRLSINPSVKFHPFDLTNFRSWMQDRHISPHNATVWVTDPETRMRWGYWLAADQANVIDSLIGGEASIQDLDPDLISRLFKARILVESEPSASSIITSTIDKAGEMFRRDRYAVITDLIPIPQLRALQLYYRRFVDQGFMRFGDSQVERRFVAYGEPVAAMIHNASVSLMTRLAGHDVKPTYCYSAVYEEDARLDPHVDREACEYSFSVQLEYLPEPENGLSPWALYLSSSSSERIEVDPANDRAVHLPNGGFLAYKGRELVHYRTPLPKGHRSTSIFFHYVPA